MTTEYLLPSSGTTTSSGIVLNPGDSLAVSSGGVAVGTVDHGTETATGDGLLNGGIVADLGYAGVSGGGSALGVTVEGTGTLQVHAGGTAISSIVSSGGLQTVYSGGSTLDTMVIGRWHRQFHRARRRRA